MKMNPVVHFEMPAINTKRVANFYTRVFGWQNKMMGKDMNYYVLAMTTDSDINGPIKAGAINGGFFPKSNGNSAQFPLVVIQVDDINKQMKKIQTAGGKVLGKPDNIPGVGSYVSFLDTEGNRVSLMQPISDNKKETMTNANTQSLEITRIFDAPRKLLWEYFTDAEKVKQWWGPKNYTAPVGKIDFRIGGKYLYCMRSPDGKDFWSTGTFKEIIPFEKLVIIDSFADKNGNVVPATYYDMDANLPLKMQITTKFADFIKVRSKIMLSHAELPEGIMKEMTEVGWNESFDKLAQAIEK